MKPFAEHILRETGFLTEAGAPAEGLILSGQDILAAGDSARLTTLLSDQVGGLAADAVFRVGSSPVLIFKSADADGEERAWHRVAWNSGIAPLLWVSTPRYVRLYNAYQPPIEYGGQSPLIAEFPFGQDLDRALAELKTICGRQHIAMGSFWRSELARKIDRRHRVDSVLLKELGALLVELGERGLKPSLAQKLVGRCIFFQYLVHRGYLAEEELESRFGAGSLHEILTDLDRTYGLFRWIRKTFNGDLFPIEDEPREREQIGDASRLAPLADFFGYFNVSNLQGRLFPFRFDIIPVELISSIYEKFVHMADTDGAPRQGVHYTPINLVDLVLDPLFEKLPPTARVLDPACGSGVFLVESLRRLVWLRSQDRELDRDLIRETLFNQIRGVDISPAALSVAAFSLYLALLELDPSPPRDLGALDCLKFEQLHDRVLFEASAFDPDLETRLAQNGDPRADFDLIVGNPPWTYSSDKRPRSEEQAPGDESATASMPTAPVTGKEYAKERKRLTPHRSPDWAFLWRAHDFAHADTRIALVMKATPFLSQDGSTSRARNALLRAFPNITLVNLSQLRTSRLFQEYEAGDDGDKQKKPTAGPALLFLSNCLPTDPGDVGLLNFPWSSTFMRTGVFELPADGPTAVSLDLAERHPGLLKAAMFGTERDAWFLERLGRNPKVLSLKAWLADVGLAAGQGYQAGRTMPADHLVDRPVVTAKDIAFGRIGADLKPFSGTRAHRPRLPEIYAGPLVLLPEGAITRSPAPGRYTAAYDNRSLAYTESFVGVSFAGKGEALAKAFAALMHGTLVSHQIAMSGGTVGVKQTKIEAVDLYALLVPRLDQWPQEALNEMALAYDRLIAASAIDDRDEVQSTAAAIDEMVADQLDLAYADIELLSDAQRRAGAILFETDKARRQLETPPSAPELARYANNLCMIFNASAEDADDLRLHPVGFSKESGDIILVQFKFGADSAAQAVWREGETIPLITGSALDGLGGSDLPHVKPSKALRLYVDHSLFVVKPAHYRCFSPAAGQSDADRVVADLMMQAASEGLPS